MPTRLVHLVADANDPAALARYWSSLLGWRIADEAQDEVDVWPAGYTYPDPVAVPIVFVRVPEPKTGKNRVHLDLASTSAQHQAELVSRATELGGRPGRHRPGRGAVGRHGRSGRQRVLRAGAAGHVPRHRPGGRYPHRLRRPHGPGPVLGGRGRAGGSSAPTSTSPGSGRPRASVPTWSSCGCPTRRRSRTGGTLTWRRTAVRIAAGEVARLRDAGATLADVGQDERGVLDRAGRSRGQRVLCPVTALASQLPAAGARAHLQAAPPP